MKYLGKTNSLDLYTVEGLSPERLIECIQQFTDDVRQEWGSDKTLEACLDDGSNGWTLFFHVYGQEG